MTDLHVLSGGALTGLINAVGAQFERRYDCRLQCQFSAVGAMRERYLQGVPCDALVLSETVINGLMQSGDLAQQDAPVVGVVQTALATLSASPSEPDDIDVAGLTQALSAASDIYLPDMARSTAGIHMKKVFEALGIFEQIKDRLREFPNGMTALRTMVDQALPAALACSQCTEIVATPGASVKAYLPSPHALRTPYVIAVPQTVDAARRPLVQHLIDFLCDASLDATKRACGFTV